MTKRKRKQNKSQEQEEVAGQLTPRSQHKHCLITHAQNLKSSNHQLN